MTDERIQERAEFRKVVRLRTPTLAEFIEESAIDISAGGIFIGSDEPLKVATLVKLEIELDDGQTVKAVGRVVWRRTPEEATDDMPAGMGVKFVKMDEVTEIRIAEAVDKGPTCQGEKKHRSNPPTDIAPPGSLDRDPTASEEHLLASSASIQLPPEDPPEDLELPLGVADGDDTVEVPLEDEAASPSGESESAKEEDGDEAEAERNEREPATVEVQAPDTTEIGLAEEEPVAKEELPSVSVQLDSAELKQSASDPIPSSDGQSLAGVDDDDDDELDSSEEPLSSDEVELPEEASQASSRSRRKKKRKKKTKRERKAEARARRDRKRRNSKDDVAAPESAETKVAAKSKPERKSEQATRRIKKEKPKPIARREEAAPTSPEAEGSSNKWMLVVGLIIAVAIAAYVLRDKF